MSKHKHRKKRENEQGYYNNYQMNGGMNPQMNGGMNPQMNGGMNPQMNGGMNPQMNGGMNPQMNGGMNPQVNGGMNPQMNGGMNPQVNGGTNPQMNGGMNPQMNWGMNPQMNGNPFMQNPLANMFGGFDMMGLLGALTGAGRGGGGNGDILSNIISAFMGNGDMGNDSMGNNSVNNNMNGNNSSGNVSPLGGLDFSELVKMISNFMGNEQAATNDETFNEERRTQNSNPINSFAAVFNTVSPKDIEAFQGLVGNMFSAAQSAINQTLNIDEIFGGINIGDIMENFKDKEVYSAQEENIDLDLNNLSLNSLNENLNNEKSEIIDVEDVVEVRDDKEKNKENSTEKVRKDKDRMNKKFTEEELYDIIKILIQLIEPYKLELLKNFLKENAIKEEKSE